MKTLLSGLALFVLIWLAVWCVATTAVVLLAPPGHCTTKPLRDHYIYAPCAPRVSTSPDAHTTPTATP